MPQGSDNVSLDVNFVDHGGGGREGTFGTYSTRRGGTELDRLARQLGEEFRDALREDSREDAESMRRESSAARFGSIPELGGEEGGSDAVDDLSREFSELADDIERLRQSDADFRDRQREEFEREQEQFRESDNPLDKAFGGARRAAEEVTDPSETDFLETLSDVLRSGVAGLIGPLGGPIAQFIKQIANAVDILSVLNQNLDRTSSQLADFDARVALAEAERDVVRTQTQLRRAAAIGDELARFTRSRTATEARFEELRTEGMRLILPIVTEANESLNEVLNLIIATKRALEASGGLKVALDMMRKYLDLSGALEGLIDEVLPLLGPLGERIREELKKLKEEKDQFQRELDDFLDPAKFLQGWGGVVDASPVPEPDAPGGL